MIGHDDIANNVMSFFFYYLEEVVYITVGITGINQRQPVMTGEGDKVDAILIYNRFGCHALRYT